NDGDDEEDQDDEGFESGNDDDDLGDVESDVETEFNEGKLGKLFRNKGGADKSGADDLAFADSDSDLGSLSGAEGEGDEDDFDPDDSDEEAAALRWKTNLHNVARSLHGKR